MMLPLLPVAVDVTIVLVLPLALVDRIVCLVVSGVVSGVG